jgi:putative membrane protein
MILPGISGAYILVLLGKYQYVLDAVNHRDVLVLALVSAGACVGIVAFSRILGWLLRNYHDLMVAILTGLMLGSLRKVWPWKETLDSVVDVHGQAVPVLQSNILPGQWNGEVLVALSLMLVGFLAVLFLARLGNRNR